jgi:GNAT superfamily N-acetyltransferase
MSFSAIPVPVQDILPLRKLYRQEMKCQIVHDSLHSREGWTQSYLLKAGTTTAGYGAIAVAGPWLGTRTAFEFHVVPEYRLHLFDLFAVFAATAGVTAFEVQTNDGPLTLILHAWCRHTTSEKIVCHDKFTSALPANGTLFRRASADDAARIFPHQMEPVGDWLLELAGEIVATGGILYHYNKPYGDIYMEVAPAFRQRGFGAYLVQELKRICYVAGNVPCARYSPTNLASRKTLQKAGFAPCAHILVGQSTPPAN